MSGSSTHVYRVLLPLIAFLLLAASFPAQSQLPEVEPSEGFYAANLQPERGSVSLAFQGSATIPVTLDDVSVASEQDPIFREEGSIYLSVEVVGNDTRGWSASIVPPVVQSMPGETHNLTLDVQSGPTVEESTVEVRIEAIYDAITGERRQTNASVMAVVESFPRINALPAEYPDTFEPDELKRVPITVTNSDIYPDMVSLQVDTPEGWMVSPPSSIRLNPGESRVVYVDIKAPDNPWFLYTSSSDYIAIQATSENSGQPLVSTGVPVSQTGMTMPAWVTPHLLMLFLGAALITKRTARKVRDHRQEKSKPSYPGLDPEHEAELEALKIEDRERASVLEDRLETLYDQRKQAWKEAYRERKDVEEAIQQAYHDRHEALVAAREDEGRDVERLERRRELLERKRALLERKRRRMSEQASQDPDTDPSGEVEPS